MQNVAANKRVRATVIRFFSFEFDFFIIILQPLCLVCLFIYLFVCLPSMFLNVRKSVCVSVYVYVCPAVCLCDCLYVSLYIGMSGL